MVASINLFEIIKTKNNASELRHGNLTALMYVKNDKPVLAVWRGKQRKPFHHYSHRTLESMYQAWEELKRSDEKQEIIKTQYQERRKQENAQMKDSIKIGDIFYTCWGYEQTNIDFFECVDIVGQFAIFKQLQKEQDCKDGWASGSCWPIQGKYMIERGVNPEFKRRIQKYMKGDVSSNTLYKWDGTPKSWSGYA